MIDSFKGFWGILVLIIIVGGLIAILSNANGAIALGGTIFQGISSVLNGFAGLNKTSSTDPKAWTPAPSKP